MWKFPKKENRDIEVGFEHELDVFYDGNDLGVVYTPECTKFRVWAPTADWIKLFIYSKDDTSEIERIEDFAKDRAGTWKTEVNGNLEGKYYVYQISVNGKVDEVVDPYTRGLGTNSKRGLIVDMRKTDPEGWDRDNRVKLENPQDAVIYEIHVRDFSISPNSGMKYKGKYLAFTEKGTISPDGLKTGVDHLKELGITHIHLQPVFDFATVDDSKDDGYNWGYDPYYYNVPEGSYSTDPSNETRIREFKKLVKSLHENGIGVIMDVVYNHTYDLDSPFNIIYPGYYYRFDEYGNYSNGSGCGNEIATEKPMVRKFIVDSVKFWAEEYHIDGFRFDLMALIDRDTMAEIEKTLHNIDPNILIYGEPWMGGLSALKPEQQFIKGAQQQKKIAVFNDHFRNAIKGDNDGISRGFVSGAHHMEGEIKKGVVAGIKYNNKIQDFTSQPNEVINYVSSHDNLTLWDKLKKSNGDDSEKIRKKMDHLAQAIIFTSQGIPFILGGEEFLRTKWGNHNSYNAGDKVNQIKWERKSHHYDTFKYYQGLIKLRKSHPAFRLKNARQIKNHLTFLSTPENTVGFLLKNNANGDLWEHIVVFYNPRREKIKFTLPFSGQWKIVVNDKQSGIIPLKTVIGKEVIVPSISAMVLYHI